MKKTCLSLNTRAIDVSKPDLPSIHTIVCRPKIFENQYFKKKILIHQKHNLLKGMLKAKKLHSCYGFSFQLKINIEIRKCS